MSENTVVIVGAGLAGATAAQTLRAEGFTGPVVLIGAEAHLPYERPPLSKGYLTGDAEFTEARIRASDWYAEHDIDLRLASTVLTVDAPAKQVVLAGDERVRYDQLLLAPGAAVRTLDVPGADLDGVHYLRTKDDSDALRERFAAGGPVVVIGAGWIGLEATSAARAAGCPVTLLDSAELPLLGVLGRELAEVFADLHREHNVDLRLGVQVESILGDGTATGVRLADGTELAAATVVVGIGVAPLTQLAADAGLDLDDGVVVDEHLQTSDPAIWAAGDIANSPRSAVGARLRVEHVENARRQGEIAARSMLGQDAADDQPPYFYSDQYDLGMEYTGHVPRDGYDEVVFRGDKDGREFIAFWLSGGTVLAGMNVNVWDVAEDIARLIGREVDPTRLADPDVALADL